MKTTMIPVAGRDFGKRLVDAGIVPIGTARVIIDIQCQGVVTIYASTYINPEECDVIFDALLDVTKGSNPDEALQNAALIALEENKKLRNICKDNKIDVKEYGVRE